MTRKYQLLIFDWDGTLMDSAQHITNCMRAAILEIGAEPRTDEQIRNIIGLGLEEAVLGLYADADEVFIQQVAEVFRQHFLFKDKTPSPLFEGTGDVLEALSSAGYQLAIATGKSRRGLDKVLADTGFNDFFPVTRCADETFSKPHPQMLDEVLTDYNLQSKDALMIGDSEYDLQMANNAKMDALAVSYGVHDLSRLLEQSPVGYVDQVIDIPAWLDT
jgi:phosphoglycolate phosphatase